MRSTSGLHVTVWGAGEPAVFVHGSFGWGTETWREQKLLADAYRLLLVDRRGFGESPPDGRVDFEHDATDIAQLLADGAHLVGHSYGGVVALLAAARRPDSVRSLAVIEPPAFGIARGVPGVETLIERIDAHFAAGQGLTEEEFLDRFLRAWGLDPRPAPRLAPAARRSVRASMTERPPWEAELPLATLAAARIPMLVCQGGWDMVPEEARRVAGAAFAAVVDILVERLAAERAVFPGAAHQPQTLGEPFNRRLEAFWRASDPA